MSSIIFPGVCNFPANSKSTIRALAPIHKAYHSRRLSASGIPSEKERKMGSTPKTATKKNKTLFDLFPPATAPSSKRFKSDSTASATHSLSSPTNNDSSSAASTDLTAQQKSRIEFQKLLAKARRNLSICSDRVSHSKSKGEGVKLEELLVEGTWLEALPSELEKPYAKTLSKFVESELCGSVPIYPPTHLIFNALNSTSFDRVKAVILGQDPYHGPGQAMGLSFSVPEGVNVPSSLVNIFKELNKDLGCSIPSHGNLEKWAVQVVESCPTLVRDNVCYVLIWSWATPHIANWFYGGTSISSWYQSGLSSCEAKRPHALHVTQLLSTCRLENPPHVRGRVESCPTLVRDNVCYVLIWSWATPHIANWFYGGTSISSQGVLLLNAVLTVRNHQANSHAKKGWEQFTDAVIKTISQKRDGVVFLLWGNSAQQKIRLIDESKHHILKAAHPSGLSANRGFFGCRHFSRTNQLLEEMGIPPIDWQL